MERILKGTAVVQGLVVCCLAYYLWNERIESPPAAKPSAPSMTPTGVRRTASKTAPPESVTTEAAPTSRLKPPPVADPLGIVMTGKIRADDGRAIAGVELNFRDPDTDDFADAQVKGDEYLIAGLHAGEYQIYARADGLRNLETSIVIDSSPATQRKDFVLERSMTIPVRFMTPDGRRLADAMQTEKFPRRCLVTAVASFAPPPATLPPFESQYLSTFAAGRYRAPYGRDSKWPEGVDGLLQIDGPLPVYVSAVVRNVVVETKRLDTAEGELVFVVATDAVTKALAELRFDVVDADSEKPIPNVRTDLSDAQTGGAGESLDANGHFMKSDCLSGTSKLEIVAKGYETIRRWVTLEAGKTLDLGTIKLAKATAIEGIVVNEKKAPVKSTILVRNLDRFAHGEPFSTSFSWGSDGAGRFKIDDAGRGRIQLIVFVGRGAAASRTAVIVDTTAGAVNDLTITLPSCGSVRFDLVADRERPFYMKIEDDLGNLWNARTVDRSGTMNERYPLGRYTLRLFDGETLVRSMPFTVGQSPLRLEVKR